jgi:hypothetical protein
MTADGVSWQELYRAALGMFAEAIEGYRAHELEFGSDQSARLVECYKSIAEMVAEYPELAAEAKRITRVRGVRRAPG